MLTRSERRQLDTALERLKQARTAYMAARLACVDEGRLSMAQDAVHAASRALADYLDSITAPARVRKGG